MSLVRRKSVSYQPQILVLLQRSASTQIVLTDQALTSIIRERWLMASGRTLLIDRSRLALISPLF